MADTKKSLAQVPAGSATTASSLLGVDSGAVKRFPITALANLLYPVGSYYWSSNPTDPGTLFGGTWEQIKDRFVLAAGGSYTVGSTGGEATHTLTVNEMPRHSHDRIACQNYYLGDNGLPPNGTAQSAALIATSGASNQSVGYYGTIPSGGSAAHNNMPPYIVAYCWHRTK